MLSIKDALKEPLDPLDAEVILAFVLNKDRTFLFTHYDKALQPAQVKKFKQLVQNRLLGWPVAYLTGKKEFFGLDFFVNKSVLIPRPETESLVELVLQKLKIENQKLKILDIGTGSGNIIISLAKNLGDKNDYFASDISKKALVVAKKNAKQHAIKITFKQGSLLNPWKNQRFDVIIANLPYLAKLEDRSTKFEPKSALVTKNKGLYLIEELLKQIASVIPAKAGIQKKSSISGSPIKSGMTKEPQYIFLEFSPRQTAKLKKLAKTHLPAYETKIFKDLTNRNRIAKMEMRNKED